MMDNIIPNCAFPTGVKAFFTTRLGGVSDPPFHSLNLSAIVGDEQEAVAENRLRLSAYLAMEARWLRQVHGNRVVLADTVDNDTTTADALYTRTPNIACVIQTADCLPVLLWHTDGRGIAAAHAGWRGIANGILQHTVSTLQQASDSPVVAMIGPAISARHYVVDTDVRQALSQQAGDEAAFTPAHSDHQDVEKWHADLVWLAKRQLLTAGVVDVKISDFCTYSDQHHFFSARRDSTTGRQAAVICMQASKATATCPPSVHCP